MFVLTENSRDNPGRIVPLGIFDHSNISRELLTSYFGEYEELKHLDIDDSGLEWMKIVKWEGELITLTLFEFELNEL